MNKDVTCSRCSNQVIDKEAFLVLHMNGSQEDEELCKSCGIKELKSKPIDVIKYHFPEPVDVQNKTV